MARRTQQVRACLDLRGHPLRRGARHGRRGMAHTFGPQVKHLNKFPAKTPDAQSRHDAVFFFAAAHPQKTQSLLPPYMVSRQNRQVTYAAEATAQVVKRGAKTGQVMTAIKLIEFWGGHLQSVVHQPNNADGQKAADFVGQSLVPMSIKRFKESAAPTRANLPQQPNSHLLFFS